VNTSQPIHRPIRSFVRREGRFTAAQRRALEQLLPVYGVPVHPELIDFARLYGRIAPVHLEIGFGNGDTLAAMARAHPENNYLGIEVHRPGVGTLLQRASAESLANIRVITTDAVDVLKHRIPDRSLSAVYLFFPDPWPKKRHHKRRLVQSGLASLVLDKLQSGGRWYLATDWEEYAEHMLAVLSALPGFENLSGPGQYAPRPESRPITRFEQRGQKLGHGVWDLVFRRR